MNSLEYIEVSIVLNPWSEEMAEIVTAEVAVLPYEAFVSEGPCLKCYIQKELYKPSDLKVVLSGFDCVESWKASMVQGENWNREWESSFEPIVVDNSVTVKASFNENVAKTRFNIWIDPKMAFGTGYHDTTYMMMSVMLSLEDRIKDKVVLDMGCGTGVLAILAAKMRARKVQAIDIDLVAANSAWGNARWNRVSPRIEVCCGDASLLQMGKFDVILANINRNILLQDLPTYIRSLRRGGTLIMSGFFEADVPILTEAVQKTLADSRREGEVPERILTRSGWACLIVRG